MSLDQELADLAGEIRPLDPLAAERVESLRLAILPSASPGGWDGVDVLDAINPAGVASALRITLFANRRLARLERLRNVLALAPILLTWFGLMIAVQAYSDALRVNPDLVETPFLLLWQRGFDGHGSALAPYFTLGHVALVDVLLIGAMIAVTWYIHSEVNVNQARRESRAADIERRLHQATWRASLELSSRTSLADQFHQLFEHSENLFDEVKAERARIEALGNERERRMADLRGFVDKFKTSANDFKTSTDGLKGAFASLEQTVVAADQRNADLVNQERKLTEALERFSGVAEAINQAQQRVGAVLENATIKLSDAADLLMRASAESTASEGTVTSLLVQLQSEFQALRNQFAQERQAYMTASTTAGEAAKSLSAAFNAMQGVAQRLDEGSEKFQELVEATKSGSLQLAATDRELSAAARELSGASAQMSGLLKAVQDLAEANTDLQRQAATAVANAPTSDALVEAWREISALSPIYAGGNFEKSSLDGRRRGLFRRSS